MERKTKFYIWFLSFFIDFSCFTRFPSFLQNIYRNAIAVLLDILIKYLICFATYPCQRNSLPSDTYASSYARSSWVVWLAKRNHRSLLLDRPCSSSWWYRLGFPHIHRSRWSVVQICHMCDQWRRNKRLCNQDLYHHSHRILSVTMNRNSLWLAAEIGHRYSHPNVLHSNRKTAYGKQIKN